VNSNIRSYGLVPWMLLGLLLIVSVPLMLCMPLTADPALYDLQAETVLEGGVLYRDIVEPNLPGIVWAHIAVRSLFGWSEYALKSVDLVIVGLITLILCLWYRDVTRTESGPPVTERVFMALMLLWFYFGTSEWCHCQRDTWMFLPALLALLLRRRQIERQDNDASGASIFRWGFVEGLVWATGFWIKPFIAIPALAAMLLGWILVRNKSRIGTDIAGVLCGGLVIGGLGTGWLITSGTWPHFWEMAIEWNPTYFEVGRERWTWDRLWRQQLRFYPFTLAHLIALPVAVKALIQCRRPADDNDRLSDTLLSAVYLGWLFQTFFLQHLFDYIHVPEVMLALTLAIRAVSGSLDFRIVSQDSVKAGTCMRAPLAGICVLLAMAFSPATDWSRIQHWKACLTEGSTPAVKTGLQHFPLPDWTELQPALDFLRQQELNDGELTIHNVYVVHAYRELNLKPSTRFVYLDVLTRVFRDHQDEIVESLDRSGHRFILSSLLENGMTPDQYRDRTGAHALPEAFPQDHLNEFPYQHPVVFRSGQYVIHEVQGSAAPLNPAFSPLASVSRD